MKDIATQDELEHPQTKRHIKVCEINHQNNLASDYTEKIESLEKSFDYASNKNHYWSEPQLSILYGTPLYAQTMKCFILIANITKVYTQIYVDLLALLHIYGQLSRTS